MKRESQKNYQIDLNKNVDTPLVAPVKFAFVHLNKPFDIAMVGQTALATRHLEISLVGQTMDFSHPKVSSKLKSWNIQEPSQLLSQYSNKYNDINKLQAAHPNSRLIGAVVKSGKNPFTFEWQDDDIITLGGANGLSMDDVKKMDDLITIPTPSDVDFLTVSTVVAALGYHILTTRGLWQKMQD